jgi:hypothetical protein
MPTKVDIAAGLARLAWIAPLLFGLALLALLCAPQPGYALVESPPVAGLIEPDEEPFEDSEDEATCEEFELEAKEEELELEEPCEETEERSKQNAVAPPECLLQTASARIFTQTARDQISLVIGYTSSVPANVTVAYRLKGGKGALNLGQTKHHFSRQGVFRITDKLNDSQMEKVRAARDFEVRIRIPSAPGYCRSYYTRHLDAKHKTHGQVVWFQSQ